MQEDYTILNNYKDIFPTGEVADRFTILLLKLEKISEIDKTRTAHQIMQTWSILSDKLEELLHATNLQSVEVEEYLELLLCLLKSNRKQWNFEDQVREKHTAEAATQARDQNLARIVLKNSINKLFQEDEEKKQYPEIK